ncbi:hypothetical protein KAR91_34105 [Candidatus Pacearchaeota archaeon]|nr:hypothetical protein [Candidatus Pacearchaeota archaeon]
MSISKVNDQLLSTGQYVSRGDAAAADYAIGDLTDNGAWQDLDLSSVVPVGAVAVHLKVGLQGSTANKKVKLRKNGNSNEQTMSVQETVVANVNQYAEHVVACDSGRVVEYVLNTVTICTIWILGWWL